MRHINSLIFVGGLLLSGTALAECQNTGDFNQWLNGFKQQAVSSGIPANVVNGALSNVSFDPSVVQRDRSQQVFAQTFLEFAGKKVNNYRLSNGQKNMRANAALFQRIEQQFGVPAPVLTAYWALETDFGANTGNFPTLRALATLAYDCRRSDFFRNELMHALRIIQKGDMAPGQMKGAWAGELGQLQFLPSGYDKHAVDYDGDGRRDLIRSKTDALASAASLLRQYGWQARQPWLLEVRVPQNMNWSLARLNNKLPLAEWAKQGVTEVSGRPLKPAGNAALLLPMGRNGPAFLAFPNFDVMLRWNESTVYSTTAAYLATRFAGAGPVRSGNAPVQKLSVAQVQQLQSKLRARGLRMTKIDGIIGEETRAAVQQVQQQLGLPADGYPDMALLRKL
ncbi:MAG: lytic murein transglycosylase [Thiolinea sp.]